MGRYPLPVTSRALIASMGLAAVALVTSNAPTAALGDDQTEQIASGGKEHKAVQELMEAAATFVTEAPDLPRMARAATAILDLAERVHWQQPRPGSAELKIPLDEGSIEIHAWAVPASRPKRYSMSIKPRGIALPAGLEEQFIFLGAVQLGVVIDASSSPVLTMDVRWIPRKDYRGRPTIPIAGYAFAPDESGKIVLAPHSLVVPAESDESPLQAATADSADPDPFVQAVIRAVNRPIPERDQSEGDCE